MTAPESATPESTDLKALLALGANGDSRVFAKAVRSHVDEIRQRVERLKTRSYDGSGFHYEMANAAANLETNLDVIERHGEDVTQDEMAARVLSEVLVEELLGKLLTAEASAEKCALQDQRRQFLESGSDPVVTVPDVALKTESRSVHVVDSYDLMAFAAKCFNVPGMYVEGASNDSSIWIPEVTGVPREGVLGDSDRKRIRSIMANEIAESGNGQKTRAVQDYELGVLLEALVHAGALPPGDYLVTICW